MGDPHLGCTRGYAGSASADLAASLGAEPDSVAAALRTSAVAACTVGSCAGTCARARAFGASPCACAVASRARAMGSASSTRPDSLAGSCPSAGDLAAWSCAHANSAWRGSAFTSPCPGSRSGTG